MSTFEISPAPADFHEWDALHRLLTGAFAGMDGRIDPPSSLTRMGPDALRDKAAGEFLVLAREGGRLAGCGFGTDKAGAFHLSKLAVAPDRQGRGLLRQMMVVLEAEARRQGLSALTLESRVELTENHAAFGALGFRKVGENAHPGYYRKTSWAFRKELA